MTRTTTNDKCVTAAAALALVFALAAEARPAVAPFAPRAQSARTQANDEEIERAKQRLARGDAAGAASALKAVAERRKTDEQTWFYLGLALNGANKGKEARRAFEKALKLRAEWPEAHAGLAYALVISGKLREAEEEAARALTADPQRPDARYVLGVVSFQRGNFERALEETEQALRLDRDFAAAAQLVGEVLLNVYIEQGNRAAHRHPLAPGAGEAARLAVYAERDAEREPLKAKMRATADDLAALAARIAVGTRADDLRELAGTLKFYALAKRDAAGAFLPADVSTKAIILDKPEPDYTPEARRYSVTGSVRVRAVLAADGTVKNVVVIKGLPNGLTKEALKAARKLKFAPATLDGRPVSQFVMLEYNFNIY